MSKSKGNYYTLRDLIDKGYDPQAIRSSAAFRAVPQAAELHAGWTCFGTALAGAHQRMHLSDEVIVFAARFQSGKSPMPLRAPAQNSNRDWTTI